jgi:hypothetical protein
MKFYVYCLAEKIDASTAALRGISDASVEAIDVEDLSFLVSKFDEKSMPLSVENALAHAKVVQEVFKETTPLPFRFGTVITEQQLREYVTAHRSVLEAKLDQVRDCVQMSVRIICNTDQTATDSSSETEGPGTEFLKEKRRQILGSDAGNTLAKDVASWLQKQVGTLIKEESVSVSAADKVMVVAAHLVAREQVAEYRGRLAEARKMRPELHFLVSGPWPPYSFSNIELEFKTRFGVS